MASRILPEGDAHVVQTLVRAALGTSRGLLHEVERLLPALDHRVTDVKASGGEVGVEILVNAAGEHRLVIVAINDRGQRSVLARLAKTDPLPSAPARVSEILT